MATFPTRGQQGPNFWDDDLKAYVDAGVAFDPETGDPVPALLALVDGGGLGATTPVSARIDIVTAGKAPIVSKEEYLSATLTITGVPGVADFSTICQIRGRGNYTWMLPKKPYKIKFTEKVSLMGMAPFDDWALLANHTDPSKINNALAFALGKASDGLDWTPSSEYAHLYLNGVYDGLYQLTETVKRGTDRVNVPKAGTTALALTGGYMLEGDIDNYLTSGFLTTHGVGIIYDDPDGANATQATYIRDRVQEFEDVLFGSTWLDPVNGYARFIDRDSFIDDYLISEVASNQEAAWHSSKKFYRTRDTSTVPGKFFMGPLWDYDIAFGSFVGNPHPPEGWYAREPNGGGPGAVWIVRMLQDPAFRAALETRWLALKDRLDTGFNALVDALSARVAAAALADQDRWGYEADWAALAAFKKNWMSQRIAWMSPRLVTPTSAPGPITNLTASGVTPTSVTLSWDEPTTGGTFTDYLVQYRVTGAGSWTTFSHDESVADSILVTGLGGGNDYDFRVAARNVVGDAAFVATTATTPDDFNPGQLPGLALWLDASDGAANSGGFVTAWNDQSGNGFTILPDNPATTPGATNTAPAYAPNGAGSGLPALVFDGVDDSMSGAVTGITTPVTMYVVADTANLPVITHSASDAKVGQITGGAFLSHNGNQASLGAPGDGEFHVFTGRNGNPLDMPPAVSGFTDSVNSMAGNEDDPSVLTSSLFYMGGSRDFYNGPFFAGSVCEVLYFSTYHADEVREQVESYLLEKWNLA